MYVSDHTRAIVSAIAERVRFVHHDAINYRSPNNAMAAAVYQQRLQQQQQAFGMANPYVADFTGSASAVTPAAPMQQQQQQQDPASPARAAGNLQQDPHGGHVAANTFSSPDKMNTGHAKSVLARRDIVDYAMRRVASVPPVTRIQPNPGNKRSAAADAFRDSAFRSELAKRLPPMQRNFLQHRNNSQQRGGGSDVVQEVLRNSSSARGGQYYASSSASQSLFQSSAERPPMMAVPQQQQQQRAASTGAAARSTPSAAHHMMGTPSMHYDPALAMGPGFPNTFNEAELRNRVGPGTERFLVDRMGEEPEAVRRAVEYTAQTQHRGEPETGSVAAMMSRKKNKDILSGLTVGLEDLEEVPYDALGGTRAPRGGNDEELEEAWYREPQQQQQQQKQKPSRGGGAPLLPPAPQPAEPMDADDIIAEARRLGLRVPGQAQMEQPRRSEFLTSAAADDVMLVGDRAQFMNLSPRGRAAAASSSAGRAPSSSSSAHYDTQYAGMAQAKLLNQRIQKRADRILGETQRSSVSPSSATAPMGARTEAPNRASSWLAGAGDRNSFTSLRSAAQQPHVVGQTLSGQPLMGVDRGATGLDFAAYGRRN